MASSDTDSVHRKLTELRMKMVQQKIANERGKLNRPGSAETVDDEDEQLRLQQAMLRRQELLDRIRNEQFINNQSVADNRRPRSYSARRRYTPSPHPPSRLSLPDLNRNATYRDGYVPVYDKNRDMQRLNHVVTHKIEQPRTYHLPPLVQTIPEPMTQQVIQQIPVQTPVFQKFVPEQPQKQRTFNKDDMMEMWYLNSQQMNQMVMQQMMLGSLYPGSHPHHRGCGGCAPVVAAAPAVEPVMFARPSAAVHHHHYGMAGTPAPAPAQPVVHHYQSLPMDGGMMMPGRDRMEPIQQMVVEGQITMFTTEL